MDKIIDYEQINSPALLIFVHGFPSHKDIKQNRMAAAKIREEGIASTLRYSSARDWNIWNKAKATNDISVMTEAFAGKTYQQELEELTAIIQTAQSRYKPQNLYLSATSYGAGLATLAGTNVGIEKLLLSCSQTSPEGRESLGCYEGFPAQQQ